MTKHTPGPWKIGEYWTDVTIIRGQIDGEEADIASVVMWGKRQGRANARLIAATPDMLYALQLARDVILDLNGRAKYQEEIDVIESAIAKAAPTPL